MPDESRILSTSGERRSIRGGALDAPQATEWGALSGLVQLGDILSAGGHTEDFVETRCRFIARRLRWMAWFFAVSVPAWIPIDWLTLDAAVRLPIAGARIALALVLVGVAMAAARPRSPLLTHALLALSVAAPAAFFAFAMGLLHSGAEAVVPVGYDFMPFVMLAVLGLYPVTLAAGSMLVAIVGAALLLVVASHGAWWNLETLNRLWAFAMFAGVALWVQAGQLMMLLKLYRESTQDSLTGLINRRVLMKRLEREAAAATERGQPFCVVVFDLDRFKRVNDTWGHLTGDHVLQTMAGVLKAGVRSQDIVARFGGEEFVAVLHSMDGTQALAVAERIRARCAQTPAFAPDGQPIALSTSAGVTQYEPGESVEATLRRADDGLYLAKALGRNRVVQRQSSDGAPNGN